MENQVQQQISGLRHRQGLLAILIFSFVTIIIWVGISLATSQRETSISPELQQLAQPLNPALNESAIQQLEQQRSYSESELSDFPIYVDSDPTRVQREGVTGITPGRSTPSSSASAITTSADQATAFDSSVFSDTASDSGSTSDFDLNLDDTTNPSEL